MRITGYALATALAMTSMAAEAQNRNNPFGLPVIIPGAEALQRDLERSVQNQVEAGIASSAQAWAGSGGSDDRSSVQTYARESNTGAFVMQGILIGAGAGVGLNCVKNIVTKDKCLDNAGMAALLGGALGAAGGWYTASENNKYASEADRNEKQLNSARFELEQARQAHEAAVRLVDKRSQQLTLARAEASKNRNKKTELNQAIADARADRASLEKAVVRLDGEMSAIRQHVAVERNQASRREYEKIVVDLEAEKTALDSQIAELDGAIQSASA